MNTNKNQLELLAKIQPHFMMHHDAYAILLQTTSHGFNIDRLTLSQLMLAGLIEMTY